MCGSCPGPDVQVVLVFGLAEVSLRSYLYLNGPGRMWLVIARLQTIISSADSGSYRSAVVVHVNG